MSKRNSQTHRVPKTPGWKVLSSAVEAVLQPSFTEEEAAWLQIQLLARCGEHIPTDRLTEMAPKLVKTCCLVYGGQVGWPFKVTQFFHLQIGREKLAHLLGNHEGWRVEPELASIVGFIVVNGNYKPPVTQIDVLAARHTGLTRPGSVISRGNEGLLVVSHA